MVTTYNTSVATDAVVYGAGCSIHSVNVTGAGAGGTMVTLYDNATAGSGDVLWEGPATSVGSFSMGNFAGGGTVAQKGIYISFSGTYTTAPVVNVVYEP